MNLEIFANSKLIEALGWTLLHSVWQIAVVSAGLYFLLRLLKNCTANTRYIASIGALACAFLLPVLTFIQILNAVPASLVASENAAVEGPLGTERDAPRSADRFVVNTGTEPLGTPGQSLSLQNIKNVFDENFEAVLPLVVALWLLGVMVSAARLCGGAWQIHVYKTRAVSEPDKEWQARFSALYTRLKIRQPVAFLSSNLVTTPIVVGFLKPFILVPAGIFLQIDPRQLETLIAHELIHVRRYDALVNFAQSAVEILFFYHPCVWWMSSVVRSEREFAADEAVIDALENSHIVYANALANLEEIRHLANQGLPSVITAANGGNLMQRIKRILQKNTETRVSTSAWSAAFACALISAVLLTVFSFNQSAFVNAQTRSKDKKIAVGFVSLPPVDRTNNPPKDSDATARLLIEKLRSHKVPAIGFVQGGMISDGEKLFPVRANIVRMWRDAGFEIGIGGFQHIWFSNTPLDQYVVNVEKNEEVVQKILDEKGQRLRYFSYPFLNTGGNLEDRVKFENWLKEKNLRYVPYTFDNDEWLYSYAYDAARNDNDLNTMKMVRDEFLDYMRKMLDYCEGYSQDLFERDIAQTLVLTPSRLVTDTADELFGMFAAKGYSFVSMDDALADDAYKTPENVVIAGSGISWLKRWASKQGMRLRDGEPKVSENVARIWKKAEQAKK